MALTIGSVVAKSEENGVARDVVVRRARLSDSETIAAFVNAARSATGAARSASASAARWISRLDVAERFGQVGFMITEREGRLAGLLGWQIENLVIRVSDLLIASNADRDEVGRALVAEMEAEGVALQAEAVILFLPPNASEALAAFWKALGYEFQDVEELPKVWREAVTEQGVAVERVMIKRLREGLVRRPV
jgi:N-acetylglutamate synthase-like GNAT family acetyltransferase